MLMWGFQDFQLAFAPKHFEEERAIWKTIVQLNLIAQVLHPYSWRLF